jgi:lysozyme
MKISAAGLALIESQEGFRSHPYQDIGGVWTIGYGETQDVGPDTPPISPEQAQELLQRRIDTEYGAAVNALGLPLTQHQFDAVCDLVYNCGVGVLEESSTFGSYLSARNWVRAADSMLLYDHDGGVVIPDLQHRRELDRALFLAPEAPTASHLDVLTASERRSVDLFDADERHPRLHAHELGKLKGYLVADRKAVWLAAVKGLTADGRRIEAGWGVEHRVDRYEILCAVTGWPPR